jgi:hypothetical protein
MNARSAWDTGRAIVVAAALGLMIAATAGELNAQDNRFEKALPFKVDSTETLAATVGPVKIASLKVTNLGRGYSRGGFSLRSANPPSELSTTLRFAFEVDNPADEEWDVTFTVELLDKAGKVIDRATKTENYEGEAKALNIEHAIIEYVLPLIGDVRVTLQGRRS